MKNFKLLTLALIGCLGLASCSSDDEGRNTGEISADLVGTFELTALNVPFEQDYDNDGDSNTNLVLEGNCYNDSWISFHNDGTYNEGYSYNILGAGGLNLDCNVETSSGTYTRNGNTVTTTKTSGGATVNTEFMYNSTTKTLTRTDNNGSYVGWNSLTSLWTNLTGTLQFTFTKYTDDDNDNGANDNDDDNINANADLLGNFNLTSYLVGTAQDLDNDGDSSTNLMTETDCYLSSKVTFKSNGTYEEHYHTSILSASGLSLECNSETKTGTWTRNGNTVTTTQTSGNINTTTEYMFDAESHQLTRTDENGQYPSFNIVNSLFSMLTGDIHLTYVKETTTTSN